MKLAVCLFITEALFQAYIFAIFGVRVTTTVSTSKESSEAYRYLDDACNNSTECFSGCCLMVGESSEDWNMPTCQKKRGSGRSCDLQRPSDNGIYQEQCPCEPNMRCVEGNYPFLDDDGTVLGIKWHKVCRPQVRRPATKKPDTTTQSDLKCKDSMECETGCCVYNLTTGKSYCEQLGTIGSLCGENKTANVYINRCPCNETLRCFSGNFVSFTPATTRTPIQVCVSKKEAHSTTPTLKLQSKDLELRSSKQNKYLTAI